MAAPTRGQGRRAAAPARSPRLARFCHSDRPKSKPSRPARELDIYCARIGRSEAERLGPAPRLSSALASVGKHHGGPGFADQAGSPRTRWLVTPRITRRAVAEPAQHEAPECAPAASAILAPSLLTCGPRTGSGLDQSEDATEGGNDRRDRSSNGRPSPSPPPAPPGLAQRIATLLFGELLAGPAQAAALRRPAARPARFSSATRATPRLGRPARRQGAGERSLDPPAPSAAQPPQPEAAAPAGHARPCRTWRRPDPSTAARVVAVGRACPYAPAPDPANSNQPGGLVPGAGPAAPPVARSAGLSGPNIFLLGEPGRRAWAANARAQCGRPSPPMPAPAGLGLVIGAAA